MKLRVVLCLAAACVLLGPALAQAADWPQWLGPKRDGSTPHKVAPWPADAPPKVLWRQPVGGGFSSPVVAGKRVFVHAVVGGKQEEQLTAFDVDSGQVLWKDAYPRPTYQSVLGTGPRATPTVAGNRLFTMGINGLLSSYDVEKGKRLWQVDLYQRFKADLPQFAVCCSPLVVGDRVIVSVGGAGRCVVGLEAATGALLWQTLDDAASTSSPVLFAGGERLRGAAPDVVFMTPLRLVGLDPLDGQLRWEHPMVFQPAGTSPTPIAVGNRMIASTQSHGAVAVQLERQDNRWTATPSWQNKDFKSYFSSGVAIGDRLFLVTNAVEPLPTAAITCIEASTGKHLWTHKGVGYFHAGVIRTGDDKLLVLNDSGLLTLLDVSGDSAKELARAKVCNGTLVTPALAGGRLFARDDRELVCLELAE